MKDIAVTLWRSLQQASVVLVLVTALTACSPSDETPSGPLAPGVRIVDNHAVVTGCEGKLDSNAEGACPWILCEAAILNSGDVHPFADIDLKGGPVSEDGTRSIIVGTATILRLDKPSSPPKFVQCYMEGGKVRDAGVISERDYNEIRYGHKGHDYVRSHPAPVAGEGRSSEPRQ
jgi:hypothetical protein